MSEKRFIDLLDVTAKSETDSPVNGAWLPITNFREATLKVELTVSAGTGVSITPKLQTRRGSGYNTTDHFVFPAQDSTADLTQLMVGLDDAEMRLQVTIAGTTVDADIKAYLSVDR